MCTAEPCIGHIVRQYVTAQCTARSADGFSDISDKTVSRTQLSNQGMYTGYNTKGLTCTKTARRSPDVTEHPSDHRLHSNEFDSARITLDLSKRISSLSPIPTVTAHLSTKYTVSSTNTIFALNNGTILLLNQVTSVATLVDCSCLCLVWVAQCKGQCEVGIPEQVTHISLQRQAGHDKNRLRASPSMYSRISMGAVPDRTAP